MKNIKTILFSLILVGTISCKKSLEEIPYSFLSDANLYENEADVDKAIVGAYGSLNFSGNRDLWYFLMTSGPSENIVVRRKAGAQGRMSSVNFVDTDPQSGIWNDFYKGINRANSVIDNISRAALDENTENTKVAQVRFLRAFEYFNLVRFFGGVPLQLSATKAINDSTILKPRSSIEEIYKSIVSDLIFAKEYLPETVSESNNGLPSSYAAKALLGKVYLTMAGKPLMLTENYAKSVAVLQDVVGKYSLVPNFADIFSINNEFNQEIIFARPNITGLNGSGTVLTFYAGAPNSPYAFKGGQYQFGFSEEFYNSFSPSDTRREVTFLYAYKDMNGDSVIYNSPKNPEDLPFGGPKSPNGIPFGKFKDPTNSFSPFAHGNDLIFLRYADVLLMLAEANNEMGNSSAALSYLNQVRNRAQLDPITETNQDMLRDIIKQERKWELAGEFTEYFDLQRWGDLKRSMKVNPDALRLHISYDPKLELYPIPLGQLQANPNLKQNPGY